MKKRLPKGAAGLDILSTLTNLLGTTIEGAGTASDGTMDTTSSALGKGVKMAGKGFLLGNAVLPGLGGLIGGLGGGLIGAISGGSEAKKQNNMTNLLRLKDQRMQNTINKQRKIALNSVYPVEGLGQVGYFAKGGNMALYGGTAQSIAPNVSRVVGDKHGQDSNMDGQQGVRVHYNGVPKAEIEGGEVMAGSKVFSAQMLVPGTNMTFADMAAKVAQSAESKLVQRFQRKLETADEPRQAATAKRMLEKHVDPLESLFDTQEQVKAQEEQMAMQQQQQMQQMPQDTLPLGRKGLDLNALGTAAEGILPYLDNLVNTSLIKKTPQIPAPIMQDVPALQTEYNINPMLANIDRQQSLRNMGLRNNTNNDAVLRNNMIAGYASDRDAINQLLGQKTNMEIGMRNQQAQLAGQTQQANIAALNAFRNMQMMRQDDIHARTSANVANAVEDAMGQRRDANQKTLDKQNMLITLMAYANTGVLDRAQIVPAMQMIEKGMTLTEALEAVKSNKTAKPLTTTPANLASNPLINSLLNLAGNVKNKATLSAQLLKALPHLF